MNVHVVNAPGYRKAFKAKLVPGMDEVPVPDTRGTVSVVVHGEAEELAVVPAGCVIRGVDLVKRYEVDYDYDKGQWGVRLAYDGPFVYHEHGGMSAWEWAISR